MIEVRRVSLSEIHLDPSNARRHPDRNIQTIIGSLKTFGQVEPLVVQKGTGKIIGGNGRYVAMREAGITEADVYELDIDDPKATALGIALNRTAELAEWDEDVLGRIAASLKDDPELLAATGFDEDDLREMLGEPAGKTDPDEVPEPPAEAKTQRGDLIVMGRHRLLCGDSTNAEDVARVMGGERAVLMNTDPPYGIAYVSGAQSKGQGEGFAEIENDELDGEKLQAFLEATIRAAVPHLSDAPAFYLWHPMLTQGTFFAAAAAAADVLIHRQIIWVKPSLILGRGDYHWRHELAFYGWIRGKRCPWLKGRDQTTVWEIGRESDGEHPTQKPVELFRRPIHNHTEPGEIVYEPFAGSGSQFIAAEELGRRCFGLEIEPRYCDVIVDRWQAFTGKKAEGWRGNG